VNNIYLNAFLFFLTLSFAQASASEIEERKKSDVESLEKMIELVKSVERNGGKGVKAVPFKETNRQYSITWIHSKGYGKDDMPPTHMAQVNPSSSGGASIAFKIQKNCSVAGGSEGNLANRVIRVDGQNINSLVGCGPDSSNPKKNWEVYLLNTDAGMKYVYRRFANKHYVFVDFGNGDIPFDTIGFMDAWNRADSPAL